MLFYMIILLLMLFIPMSSSFNSTLRLYDSFAEIHQEYNGPLCFQQTDWDNIKHESIILRPSSLETYNNDTSIFERRIIRINKNMTGKTVFVRRYPEHKYPVLCEIITEDNNYVLVREIESGHYFRTQINLIEYIDEPLQLNSIYEVSFNSLPSNHSFIISYVIKNLRWQTRYTLQTYSNHSTKFQILVDIINSSPSTYEFYQTHLMSGDINLAFTTNQNSPFIIGKTSIQDRIDYSGIYLFSSINNSLIINPYSILTLPIHSPDIQIQTIFIYTLVLSMPSISSNDVVFNDSNKDKFQRLYKLSNNTSFLPTGHLLLYDSSANILTGEWYLPTLVESENYEFKLGEDPDVTLIYNRTININQKANSSLITVNILIQNYKQQKIHIRFKSICELSMICLFYDDKARSLGSRLRYELFLKPKSEVVFSYTTIRLF